MTIREIAELAGVSISTVSKIVNGKDAEISRDTRERVLGIVQEYGYRPYAAQVDRSRRTLCLGLVANDALPRSVLLGMLAEASERGYTLALRMVGESGREASSAVNALLNLGAEALALPSTSNLDEACARRLLQGGLPILTFGDPVDPDSPLCVARPAALAATALLDCGHERIALVAPRDDPRSPSFVSGVRNQLLRRGLPFDEELVLSEPPLDQLTSGIFSGVLTLRPSDAQLILSRANSLNIPVPKELSLVTLCDDEPLFDDAEPACSRVRIDGHEAGRRMTRRLLATGGDAPDDAPAESHDVPRITIAPPRRARRRRVLSIGSINVDNYLFFDRLPTLGGTVTTDTSSVCPGGKCTNEAIGVTLLGLEATVIGCVGSDEDGSRLIDSLRDSGVITSGIMRTSERPTGQAYIFVPRDGESMISIMSGANERVSVETVRRNESLFAAADCCLVQTEIPIGAVREACRVARDHGLPVIMKPSSIVDLPEDVARCVDVLVPNENELAVLCPDAPTEAARAKELLSRGVGVVVVTSGQNGCSLYRRDGMRHFDAPEVPVIDSSGAGDAFVCTLASYHLLGYTLEASCAIANYAAALSTTRQGTSASLVDRSTLEAHIRKVSPEVLVR